MFSNSNVFIEAVKINCIFNMFMSLEILQCSSAHGTVKWFGVENKHDTACFSKINLDSIV